MTQRMLLLLAMVSALGTFFPLVVEGAAQSPSGRAVVLATTTSTQDTGLLDRWSPLFEKQTGDPLKVIAVGSGQALAMGRRGDADVLLVHAPEEEKRFMDDGHGVKRRTVMVNDFILVGPAGDPARVSNAPSAAETLRRIAAARAPFFSRGDESGTHLLEKRLWGEAGIQPQGGWYQQSGQGMGQTLVIASEKSAYSLSDRGTYLSLRKRIQLVPLFQGDPKLINLYSVIQVDPKKSPRMNPAGAEAFIRFVFSPEARGIVKKLGIAEYGEPLFRLVDEEKR